MQRYRQSSSATMIRVSQERPNSHEARFFVGLKLIDEGKPEESLAWFRGALGLKPDYLDATWYLGKTLLDLGRHLEAEEVLLSVDDFIHLQGERAEMLGEIYRFVGRLADARARYREALRLGRGRVHHVHVGLSDLFHRGVDFGIGICQSPLVDQRIVVDEPGPAGVIPRSANVRLRIFRDCTDITRKVVIFTSEADMPAASTSVINAAEWLVAYVLRNNGFGVDAEKTTWVTLFERGVHGCEPMHISKLKFDVRIETKSASGLGWWLSGFMGAAQPELVPDVQNLEFQEISHAQLELRTGNKFYWN